MSKRDLTPHRLTAHHAIGQSSKMKPVAVLASGGIDSSCLMAWAARKTRAWIQPIYVTFGLRWENSEQKALRNIIRALRPARIRKPVVLTITAKDIYKGHWSLTGKNVPGAHSRDEEVYLPGRNLLMLSKAAVYCSQRRIECLAIGTLAANPFSDATPEFFASFSKLATAALGRRIRILAPFRRLTKKQLRRKFAGLPLHLCFSCLRPRRGKPCGRCNKCVEWKNSR